MDAFKSDEITKLYNKLTQVEFGKTPKKSWFVSKIQKIHNREEEWDDVACYQKINTLNYSVIKAYNELKGIVIELDDELLKAMHLVGTKYDVGRWVVHTKAYKDYLAVLQNNKFHIQSLISTLNSIMDDTTWTGTLYSKYFNDIVQIMKDLDLITTTSTMLYIVYTQNGNPITRFAFGDTELEQIKLDETNADSKVYSEHDNIKTATVEGTKGTEQANKSTDNKTKTTETTRDTQNTSQDTEQASENIESLSNSYRDAIGRANKVIDDVNKVTETHKSTQNTSQDTEQLSKDSEDKESLDTLNAKYTDGEIKIDDEYIADYIQNLLSSVDTSEKTDATSHKETDNKITEKSYGMQDYLANSIQEQLEQAKSSQIKYESTEDIFKRHMIESSIETSLESLKFLLKCVKVQHVLDTNIYTDEDIDTLVRHFEADLRQQLDLHSGSQPKIINSATLRNVINKFAYSELSWLMVELSVFKNKQVRLGFDDWFSNHHNKYYKSRYLTRSNDELVATGTNTNESLDTTVIESTDTDNDIDQNDTEEVSAVKSFDLSSIVKLQKRLKAQENIPSTEEATKLWLIMPLINALGYNPYSSDIVPEYTLDVGVKKGEKVDYALQINNQPVALIECKKFGLALSEKHISQLYRYFTISDVHIAILTNGDDYWFFTDSQKENVMDIEPYYKIRISEANTDELSKLEQYSKDMIQYADINKVVRYEKYVSECKSLVHGLRTNNIPTWLLDTLAKRSGLDIDKPTLAEYLYTEIKKEFNGFKAPKAETKSKETPKSVETTSAKSKSTQEETKSQTELGIKMQETRSKNRKNRSNIRLNYPYVFNDYSDGDWRFHTLDYAVILGVRYEDITARDLLVHTVTELFKQGKITREAILKETQFDRAFKINAVDNCRRSCYLEDYDVYVETSYSILSIVTFIQKLLDYAGLPYESVIISFKD